MNWNNQQLNELFKAYDVRGIYPDQINEEIAYETGRAFVEVLKVREKEKQVVIGQDMRPSGSSLVNAFARGVCDQGVDAILMGLCSTDALYFATGKLNLPGAMFTASHNPAQYNGIKLARAGAAPVGELTGLFEIKELIQKGIPDYSGAKGQVHDQDLIEDYGIYLRNLVNLSEIRKLKIVIDAGNGMAGFTVPRVLKEINLEIIPLYFELDGSFPNHEANPIDPKNLRDLQNKVKEFSADLGIAFDGDADRAFFVDETGSLISPSAVTALIAERELKREPGATIIYNLISSKVVPEVIQEQGGVSIKSRVGHSFIKQLMKDKNAIFGGEHSGHFYFRDFWFADSGMLAALHVLAAVGETRDGAKVSDLFARYNRYFASGEINTRVTSPQGTSNKVAAYLMEHFQVIGDDLDGLTFSTPNWWVNVRPSNTEPLLRFNAEANTPQILTEIQEQVLGLIREDEV